MIYMKTPHGQAAFQGRTVPMTPRQRSAFILFDGKRNLQDVMKATAGLGITPEDIDQLLLQGLLAPREDAVPAIVTASVPPSAPAAPSASPSAVAAAASLSSSSGLPTATAQAHYSKAYPIATRLTAGLGLRGFLLNLAVEGATDLAKLQELAPKIMKAVGPEKFSELQGALYD